jgi:hypothetical protein
MAVLNLTDIYIAYFRNIAIQHALIAHKVQILPNGDIGDPIIGQATFDVLMQSEVKEIQLARTYINPNAEYLLLAILPGGNSEEREDANHFKNYFGGYIILKKTSTRTDKKDTFWKNMPDAERVGLQIAARMVEDSKNKHPLFARQSDVIHNLKLRWQEKIVEDIWYGYLFTFHFQNIIPSCADATGATWLDSGLTPHNIKL